MDSKKTQKIVVVILVITALLGIVGALFVYSLSTQDGQRLKFQDSRLAEEKKYCACITAYTTPSCNDCSCTQIETQVLESEMGEVVDGVCSLDCDTRQEELENETPEMINCLIPEVKESSCHSISVKDKNTRELLIPPISTNEGVLITGNFVPREINGGYEEFTNFSFVINGEATEIPFTNISSMTINEKETFLPEIEFSNFQDINTLTIQATSSSDREPGGAKLGRYCYKRYNLTHERSAFCSNLSVETTEGTTPTTKVIKKLQLNTPNLTSDKKISIAFTFDNDNLDPITTKEITKDLLEEMLFNEKIILEYEQLYSTPSLFVDENTFPAFDLESLGSTPLRIFAQVYSDDVAIDSDLCNETISLRPGATDDPDITDPDITDPDITDPDITDPDTTDPDTTDPDTTDPDTTDPDITDPDITDPDEALATDLHLVMEGPSCVKKAEDDESISRANYRITIRNSSTEVQEVEYITNKLPLGWEYIENSTSINGTLVNDSILEITTVGTSQELVWTNNWLFQPNTALTLEYGVNVTNQALDGENQNEAVATPQNVTVNMDRLRGEVVTTVTDDCEIPSTANLTMLSFIVGILTLIFGILVYQGQIHILDNVMLKLINARIIRKTLRPKEYFEDSILEKEDED